MSIPTPATQAFLDRWNPLNNAPNLLVRIELAVPSALVLNLSIDPVRTPDGVVWQPVLGDSDPIHAPGDLLSAGPTPCSGGFRIRNTRLTPQSSGTATDLMNQYVWKGAKISAWLWEAGLTSFSDALPVLLNGIIQGAPQITRDEIYIRCIQRKAWRKQMPPKSINRIDYPAAPEASIGLPLPVIYGFHVNDGLEPPWTSPYPILDEKLDHEDVGASGLVVPGILVDTGIGSADAKVLFAGHPLALIGNANLQSSVKMDAGSHLASLLSPDILGDNSGFNLEDEENIVFVGIPCIDVRTGGSFPNTALNPRAAMEIFDSTSYAIVKNDGGNDCLALIPGSVGELGQMLGAELVIGYRCSHTTTDAKIYYNRPGIPGGGLPVPASLTAHNITTNPVTQRLVVPVEDATASASVTAGAATTDWNIGVADLLVRHNSVQVGHYIHVFFVAMVIKYRPAQSLVAPALVVTVGRRYDIQGADRTYQRSAVGQRRYAGGPFVNLITSPAIYEIRAPFYANVHGWKDVSGDHTGVTNAVLTLPPDIIHHLLDTYGGESTGLEVGINKFGSFVRARPLSVSIEGNPLQLALHVGEESDVADAVARLARNAPAWCYISRFDDRWHYVPWLTRRAAADFPRRLKADDIISFEIEESAETEIVNSVRVDFAHDYYRNRYLHTVSVGPVESNGGWSGKGRRDQLLKVIDTGSDQNNKIDFLRSAVTHAATLMAGTYTPAGMMVQLKAALNALAIAGAVWNSKWGGTVVASHNDRLDFTSGAGTFGATVPAGGWTIAELAPKVQATIASHDVAVDARVGMGLLILEGFNDQIDFSDGVQKKVTLPPGYYRDGDQLAVYVALALNSQSSNWTCTYSGGTRKFTIGRSSGTASLLWLTGANHAKSAGPALGFTHTADRTGGSSYVGDYGREHGRFWIQTKTNLTLLWLTGANRPNSVACALGFHYFANSGPALNHEADVLCKDEHLAITSEIAIDILWFSGTNAAINAAYLLGFNRAANQTSGRHFLADRRRGERETRAAESATWFGNKQRMAITAPEINTTEQALHVRDTYLDIRRDEPQRIKIRTHRFPDLERGRVVEVEDLSSLGIPLPPRYGGGTWAGKLLVALEVAQMAGRSWHQEIVFAEAKDILVGASTTASDGATGVPGPAVGTAIVIYSDNRDGTYALYALRLDTNGTTQWTTHGVLVSAPASGGIKAPANQDDAPKVIVDGDGSSIMTWLRPASTFGNCMVQKLNASGAAQWTAGGVLVSGSSSTLANPTLCSDASGGAYIVWQDSAAQSRLIRVAANGTFPSGWAVGGKHLAATSGTRPQARACPDGFGGVIVVWQDSRGASLDVYVQRWDAAGNALWTANGVPVTTASLNQAVPFILADGTGGCIVAWEHLVGGNTQIQAQRVDASGVAQWTANGIGICSATGHQRMPRMIADGAGGAIICWHDERSGGDHRVFAQRVTALGSLLWTADGVNVMKSRANNQPQILPDGVGGAYFAQTAGADVEIRVQRVSSAGAVLWADVDGTVIASGTGTRLLPSMAPDGAGGILVVWEDSRNVGNATDIYAQRLNSGGSTLWTTNGVPVIQRTADQRIPWVATV